MYTRHNTLRDIQLQLDRMQFIENELIQKHRIPHSKITEEDEFRPHLEVHYQGARGNDRNDMWLRWSFQIMSGDLTCNLEFKETIHLEIRDHPNGDDEMVDEELRYVLNVGPRNYVSIIDDESRADQPDIFKSHPIFAFRKKWRPEVGGEFKSERSAQRLLADFVNILIQSKARSGWFKKHR